MYNYPMSIDYFEDIKPHHKYRSREYYLKEKEIIDYAKQWDPQPFHIDPEFAKSTKFTGLFASGSHLLAISYKMISEREPKIAYIAGLGWDKVQFLAPARPGDVLIFEEEVVWKRESKSDPNAGIVHFAARLLNQQGKAVSTMEVTGLIQKRTAVETPSSGS
jgi:acyl dehydratase